MRCLVDAKMHGGKVCYGNKNCRTEDNSPKYRMVGNVCSSLRANAKQSSETGATHVAHWNNSRKIAFTLAEVLVTLGIIGVVSAMTVPTLMQNYQRQSYVTQLHKVYNEFSQASLRYLTDRNALNLPEAGLTDINAIDSFMKTYFKIAKDCGDDINACFPNDYKKVDGTSVSPVLERSKGKNYILANGAAIFIFKSGYGVQIHVDVNGKKGPNIVGRDIFAMALYNNGLLDDGCGSAPCTTEKREELFNSYCIKSSGDTWWGCFGKILNDNWQMTY